MFRYDRRASSPGCRGRGSSRRSQAEGVPVLGRLLAAQQGAASCRPRSRAAAYRRIYPPEVLARLGGAQPLPGQRPAVRGGRLVRRRPCCSARGRTWTTSPPRSARSTPGPPTSRELGRWRSATMRRAAEPARRSPAACAAAPALDRAAPLLAADLAGRGREGEDHAAHALLDVGLRGPHPPVRGGRSRTSGRRRWRCATARGTGSSSSPPTSSACRGRSRPRSRRGPGSASASSRSQLVLNASHTHCGPAVRENLAVLLRSRRGGPTARWTPTPRELADRLVEVVGRRAAATSPRPGWRSGTARSASPSTAACPPPRASRIGVNPDGPVDHDVPVLKVTAPDGSLRAVLFGYACHNTTLGADVYQIDGDYAGHAQAELERAHPGATALFLMLCGGDQNPHPRGTLELAREHGRALAAEVGPRAERAPCARCAPRSAPPSRTIPLDFAPHTREAFEEEARSPDVFRQRRARLMLAAYDARPARPRDAVPGAGRPARERPDAPGPRRRAGGGLRPAPEAGVPGREPDRGRLLPRRHGLHPLPARPPGGRLRGGREHDLLRPAGAARRHGRGRHRGRRATAVRAWVRKPRMPRAREVGHEELLESRGAVASRAAGLTPRRRAGDRSPGRPTGRRDPHPGHALDLHAPCRRGRLARTGPLPARADPGECRPVADAGQEARSTPTSSGGSSAATTPSRRSTSRATRAST